MPDGGSAADPRGLISLPVAFLRDLTRSMLGQIRGRGSSGRRHEIAAQLASLLSESDIDGLAHLTIAKVVVEELNSDSTASSFRLDFSFDAKTGALCWSPDVVATLLGVDRKSLADMRKRGEGPRYIKLGDAPQARTIYKITEVLDWLASREEATNERFAGHAA